MTPLERIRRQPSQAMVMSGTYVIATIVTLSEMPYQLIFCRVRATHVPFAWM